MRFRTKAKRSPIINLVSLIDILCIVLIFFVVTSTFKRDEPQIKLDLPKSTQAKTVEQATPEIITVTDDGKIYLGDKPVDPDDLGKLLKAKKDAEPGSKFALKASKNARFESVVKVMDAVTFAGIEALPTYTAEKDGSAAPAP